jgi:nucleotide-binding universal stress UspA family protein
VCLAWAPGYPALPNEDQAAFDLAKRYGERTLACGLRLAQDLLGSGDVRPLLVPGPAAAVLCKQSASSTMVVVGSRGHSGLTGLVLGSVSSQVAMHARGPVVVVRGHWRQVPGHAPGPIVAGSDGSPAAEAAVEFAFAEAALHGGYLLAVCAQADAPGSLGDAHRIEEDFHTQIGRWEAEHPEVAVRRQVMAGSARSALLAAIREAAQLVVVGSRGRGGVRGMMLGSVSQALLLHAACPVSVVHPR